MRWIPASSARSTKRGNTPRKKDRVSINSFSATFQGNHNSYDVTFDAGAWDCECHFFATRAVCSHTMALQRMLDDVLAKVSEHRETIEVQ